MQKFRRPHGTAPSTGDSPKALPHRTTQEAVMLQVFRPAHWARLALVALIFSACLSCDRPQTQRWQVLAKFTDGEAVDWQSTPSIFQRDMVFSWTFESDEEIALWGRQNIDMKYQLQNGGLYIRSSSTDPYIYRDGIVIDTDKVDQIRIKRSPNHGESFQIFWADAGEHFTEERSMRQHIMDSEGKQLAYYTFDVGKHERWSGTVERFRIDPAEISERRSRLMTVEGSRRVLDGEKLAQLVDRPMMQDFSGDARLSLLAPPGYVHERELKNLPSGSRMRFAYGTQAIEGPPVSFRVEAEVDGTAQLLFEASVDPAAAGEAWTEQELSLDALSGKDVKLRLVTSGIEPDDLIDGFPLWGHPTVSAPADGEDLPPNLVFIVADTLRADRTSLYGYDRPTTPRLDAWAADKALVFENTVAAAPWTLPSHVTMFTGLNPLRHAVNYTEPAPDSLNLLAEQLRDAGYNTKAFTGGAFLSPSFRLTQGFEHFIHWGNINDPDHGSRAGLDLDTHLPQALSWLDEGPDGPFMLLFHSYEVHAPYTPRQPWFDQFKPAGAEDSPSFTPIPGEPVEDQAWRFDSVLREMKDGQLQEVSDDRMEIFQAVYDSGVAQMDDALGQILDRLSALDLERETIVVFTSDHGEGLGDHGKAGHAYLYDFNLMVPLVISIPGNASQGKRVDNQVRQIDIMPTLLDAMGLEPAAPMDGKSLLPFWEDEVVTDFPRVAQSYAGSSNYGLSLRVADRWKYIFQHAPWKPIFQQQELFDLREDPTETNNLVETDQDRAESFREEIQDLYNEQTCRFEAEARNQGEYPLEIFFHGVLAQPLTVKTFHLDCDDCARWYKSWSRFILEPGESIQVFLEGSQHSDLKARARFLDGSPHTEERPGGMTRIFQVWEIVEGQPFGIRGRPGQDRPWNEVRKERPWKEDESGLMVRWLGDGCPWVADGSAPVTNSIDDETRKQLEALGYVN